MRLVLLLALAFPAGVARADTLTAFHTPSGNIHCLGIMGAEGAFVDCELIERDNPVPLLARPADCDLDWGQRFTISEAGPAAMACHGDTVRDPNGAVLPYGASLRFGSIACASSERGLECRNASGHGFFLSRARQALY